MNVMEMQKKITVLVQYYQSNTADLHIMRYHMRASLLLIWYSYFRKLK